MTPEEVALYLRISRVRTIYDYIADRQFPNTIIIKRQYRIPKSDVEKFEIRSRIQDNEIHPLLPAHKRRVISKGV